MRARFESSEARETDRKGQPEGRGQRRINVATSRGSGSFPIYHNAYVHRVIANDACIGAPSHAAEPLKRVPMRCSSIPGSAPRAIPSVWQGRSKTAVEGEQEAVEVGLASQLDHAEATSLLAAFLRESSASGGAQVLSTSPCSR